MHATYFTLRAWTEELLSLLAGARLQEAYTQEPEELRLLWALPDGAEATWFISLHPARLFSSLRPGRHQARSNVGRLFAPIREARLRALTLAHRDRVWSLELDTPEGLRRLHIFFYRQGGNAYLEGGDRRIQEAFLRPTHWQGQPVPQVRPAWDPERLEQFETAFDPEAKSALKAFLRAVPLADRLIATEVLYRVGLSPEDPVPREPAIRERIWSSWQELRISWEKQPAPRLYEDRGELYFALGPMAHLEEARGVRPEPFPSVNEALCAFLGRWLSRSAFEGQLRGLLGLLERREAHLQASREALERELAEPDRAACYELWGHLLLAYGHEIRKGQEKAELEDPASGARASIPLDPALSVWENAQHYYEKARKARQARARSRTHLEEVQRRLQELERARASLLACRSVKELRRWEQAHRSILPTQEGGKEKPGAIPFRRFSLPGGYEVWVGKNAEQNDLLLRYARPHDFWLHAQGVEGAHALLRRPHKTEQPPRAILEAAARIAAYYSRARSASQVAVVVAERRFIRKPRGASAGRVQVQRGHTWLVKPGLPEEG